MKLQDFSNPYKCTHPILALPRVHRDIVKEGFVVLESPEISWKGKTVMVLTVLAGGATYGLIAHYNLNKIVKCFKQNARHFLWGGLGVITFTATLIQTSVLYVGKQDTLEAILVLEQMLFWPIAHILQRCY
ncbi:hypothetical protein K0U07_05545 [bacterium]|nr:hypothetical protein [bacterium]